jgi:hypothetical protein
MCRKVIASLFFVLTLGLSVAAADEVERWLRDARSPVLQVRLHALQSVTAVTSGQSRLC